MSYKYFGRLAGNTDAVAALSTTSESSVLTKFILQLPAAKFFAYGEAGTDVAWNRALGALSANTDYLKSIMDTPALRADVLTPYRNEAGKTYGYSSLTGLAPGATSVNVGSVGDPPVWLYVGLHKANIGKYLQFRRARSTILSGVDDPDVAETHYAEATDVQSNGAPGSYFPAAPSYVGSTEHAIPDFIPGVTRVDTDLVPYSAGTPTVAIDSWQRDGVYVTAPAPDTFYIRPGVLVEIVNADVTSDNGLYRVTACTYAKATDPVGSKLTLTRAYHEVTVDDVSNFEAGERVTWQAPPDHAAASTGEVRGHSAHVVHKVTTGPGNQGTLYLANFGGGEDFSTSGAPNAYKVRDDIGSYHGMLQHNNPGLTDQESDAEQNWTIPTTTRLYETGLTYATVLGAINSGASLAFSGNSTTGDFYVCAPPGWVLNPTILVGADTLLGGDYYVHGYTMTTVRERLQSGGASSNVGTLDSTSEGHGLTRAKLEALQAHLKFTKSGSQALAKSPNTVNGPFGPTRKILGEDLWVVTLANISGNGRTADQEFSPGDSVTWSHLTKSADTASVVVDVGSNDTLVLKKVVRATWSMLDAPRTAVPLDSNFQHATLHPTTWGVDTIVASPVLDSGGGDYYMSFGLNAAYHNQDSSDPSMRGEAGQGNRIDMVSGTPLQLRLAATPGEEAVNVYTNTGVAASLLQQRLYDDTLVVDISSDAANTLRLKDANTGNIPLSDATHNALPPGVGSILEGLNKSVLGSPFITGPWSTALLGGGVVTQAGLQPLVSVGLYVKQGLSYVSSELTATLTLGSDEVRFLLYTVSADSYSLDADLDLTDNDVVPLAKYTTVGGFIVEIILLAKAIRREDTHLELFVGTPDSAAAAYPAEIGHFAKLSEAFAFIDVVEGDADGYSLPWVINVIGNVSEDETTLPLVVPVHGLTVKGTPHADHQIRWSTAGVSYEGAFFDLNNRSGLTFKGLNILYDDYNAAYDGVVSRVVWDEAEVFVSQTPSTAQSGTSDTIELDAGDVAASGFYNKKEIRIESGTGAGQSNVIRAYDGGVNIASVGNDWVTPPDNTSEYVIGGYSSDVLIERCTVSASTAATARLHGYVRYVQAGGDTPATGLTIRDCTFSGATEFAVMTTDVEVIRIEKSSFIGETSQDSAGDGGQGGIVVASAAHPVRRIWVKDNFIEDWEFNGISFAEISGGWITDNIVENITVSGGGAPTTVTGILVDDACANVNVVGNNVSDVGVAASLSVGIYVDGLGVNLSTNRTAVLAGAPTVNGILLGISATNCIADMNQTSGHGLADAGTGNTVGANNRDDL